MNVCECWLYLLAIYSFRVYLRNEHYSILFHSIHVNIFFRRKCFQDLEFDATVQTIR